MQLKHAYLGLTIIGTALPVWQFMPFVLDHVRHLWAPLAGNLLVGASLGLPLYLYLRERALTHAESGAQ